MCEELALFHLASRRSPQLFLGPFHRHVTQLLSLRNMAGLWSPRRFSAGPQAPDVTLSPGGQVDCQLSTSDVALPQCLLPKRVCSGWKTKPRRTFWRSGKMAKALWSASLTSQGWEERQLCRGPCAPRQKQRTSFQRQVGGRQGLHLHPQTQLMDRGGQRWADGQEDNGMDE